MEIRVRWLRYDSSHDTWEPVANLAEDVPELVEEYLRGKAHEPQCVRALARYFPG